MSAKHLIIVVGAGPAGLDGNGGGRFLDRGHHCTEALRKLCLVTGEREEASGERDGGSSVVELVSGIGCQVSGFSQGLGLRVSGSG